MDWYVTCAYGLESLLAQELDDLGVVAGEPRAGVIPLRGNLKDAYRVCLWSRLATSVVAGLAKGRVASADELTELAANTAWEDALARGTAITVTIQGSLRPVAPIRKAQEILYQAIRSRMLDKTGTLPPVSASDSLGIVVVANPVSETVPDSETASPGEEGAQASPSALEVSLGVDLCGEPLWKRGYERFERRGLPTLRPDVAAAALLTGGWNECVRSAKATPPALGVMFSGAATLIAEAAAMAKDIAPGLLRLKWGFEHWLGHSLALWTTALTSAKRRQRQGSERPLTLLAADDRKGSRDNPRSVLRAMGIGEGPLVSSPLAAASFGTRLGQNSLAVIDLSWVDETQSGTQLLAASRVTPFCGGLFPGQPGVILTRPEPKPQGGNALSELPFRSAPTSKATVTVGRASSIELLSTSDLSVPSVAASLGTRRTRVLASSSQGFAQELMESSAKTMQAAAEESVSCYRVYDRNLPDYPLALDLYQGAAPTPGRWLVMSSFEGGVRPAERNTAGKGPEDDRVHGTASTGEENPIDNQTAVASSLHEGSPSKKGADKSLATTGSADESATAKEQKRLLDAAQIAPQVLDVAPVDVELKLRRRAKGGSQYAKGERRAPSHQRKPRMIAGAPLPFDSALIEEGGLLFEVNLSAHLDTGIFLDTRTVRSRLREMAKALGGKRSFLNLFAYTGTATCYAADGGCLSTTTVDLSASYLEIARRNLLRNGFLSERETRPSGDKDSAEPSSRTGAKGSPSASAPSREHQPHEFVRADALNWITEQRRGRRRWDLIYCDPPTFSNSKAMRKSFDVQRDHLDLLIGISKLLAPGGVALFCCNLSTFTPDLERLGRANIELTDITSETIPFDFRKDPPPHHCYLLRRELKASLEQ